MIGIISDTHDNVPNVIKAVGIFRERNAELVLHLGDIVAPATVMFFRGLKMRFIRGNCDGDIELMQERIREIGGEWLGEFGEMKLEGKRIAMVHGKDQKRLQELIDSKAYDYVLYGHTHQARDERIGRTRIINPGGHYLSPGQAEHTIAMLDVKNGEVEFINIE